MKKIILSFVFIPLMIGVIVLAKKNDNSLLGKSTTFTSKIAQEQLDFLKQEEFRIQALLEAHGVNKDSLEKEKLSYLKDEKNYQIYQESTLNRAIK